MMCSCGFTVRSPNHLRGHLEFYARIPKANGQHQWAQTPAQIEAAQERRQAGKWRPTVPAEASHG